MSTIQNSREISYHNSNAKTKKYNKTLASNDYDESGLINLRKRSSSRSKKFIDGLIFIPNLASDNI